MINGNSTHRTNVWMISLLLAVVFISGCAQREIATGFVYPASKTYSAPTIFSQMVGIPMEGIEAKVYYVENTCLQEMLSQEKNPYIDTRILLCSPMKSMIVISQ